MKFAVALAMILLGVNVLALVVGVIAGNYLIASANALACILLFLAWRRGVFALKDMQHEEQLLWSSTHGWSPLGKEIIRLEREAARYDEALEGRIRDLTVENNRLRKIVDGRTSELLKKVGYSDEAALRAEGKYCDTFPGTATDQPTSRTVAAPIVPSPSKKYGL